ncbi:MAG: hypothetical protein QM308_07665 [Bacillota bacterium]|nr:hypothetical protein [Bacillota bacterium]
MVLGADGSPAALVTGADGLLAALVTGADGLLAALLFFRKSKIPIKIPPITVIVFYAFFGANPRVIFIAVSPPLAFIPLASFYLGFSPLIR